MNSAVCQLHNFATIFFQGYLHTPEKISEDIDIGFEATIDQKMCDGHKREMRRVAQLLGTSTVYRLQEKNGIVW